MNPELFSKLKDTSPQAEEIQIALLRKLTPAQRLAKTFALSDEVIRLSKRAIRRQNPGLNEFQLNILYLRYFYGHEIADKVEAHLIEKNGNESR